MICKLFNSSIILVEWIIYYFPQFSAISLEISLGSLLFWSESSWEEFLLSLVRWVIALSSTVTAENHKVWGKKKCTRVCVYYKNYARFRQKSIKSAKSTHPENSKLVRQVHVVQKVPPGSMIEQKNGFCENTIFVKNYLQKKVHLHLWFSCKIC